MGFWKFPPFLLLSCLVLYQVCLLQAAPIRFVLESRSNTDVLPEDESSLFLDELANAYVQMKTSELEKEQETDGSSITAQKRSCNTATCVTHQLAGLLSSIGSASKNNFLPTNKGFKVFGKRRRNLQH